MNDELKTWIRILKFGMPSVVSYAFVLSGMILMISHFDTDPIIGFQGLSFALLGMCVFYMTQSIRLGNELKEIKACQTN